MTRLREDVRWLLPKGSNPGSSDEFGESPNWLPDAFAVAATLAERCDCYAALQFSTSFAESYVFNDSYHNKVRQLATEWREAGKAPSGVQAYWGDILNSRDGSSSYGSGCPSWSEAALTLIAVADQASI